MGRTKQVFIFSVSIGLFCASVCNGLDIDTTSYFISPEHARKISIDFRNAPLTDVLKVFSRQMNLSMIASDDVAARTVTVYLDNVPVHDALEQILAANNLVYERQPGTNICIVRQRQDGSQEVVTRVYPLKYASVRSSKINTLIQVGEDQGGVSIDGASAGGIISALESVLSVRGRVREDPRTNSLVVTDAMANFSVIEQMIASLDISVPQILIEVEMLEVAKSHADKIGIQWGDSPLVFTGGQKHGVFPFDGSVPFFSDPGGVAYEEPRYYTSVMDAQGLTATVQFLKSQSDTRNLARPRILTLNNQAAEIKISTNEAIGIQTSTQSSDGISVGTIEAERVETGVSLIVTPQANPENGMITMAIQPKVIIAKEGATFTETTFKDPEERSAKTILRVATGDTIIIGGLVREDETKRVTKVPLLGDLPLIGKAFRHTATTKSERELMIFITPHILPDPERPAAAQPLPQRLLREQESPVLKNER